MHCSIVHTTHHIHFLECFVFTVRTHKHHSSLRDALSLTIVPLLPTNMHIQKIQAFLVKTLLNIRNPLCHKKKKKYNKWAREKACMSFYQCRFVGIWCHPSVILFLRWAIWTLQSKRCYESILQRLRFSCIAFTLVFCHHKCHFGRSVSIYGLSCLLTNWKRGNNL